MAERLRTWRAQRRWRNQINRRARRGSCSSRCLRRRWLEMLGPIAEMGRSAILGASLAVANLVGISGASTPYAMPIATPSVQYYGALDEGPPDRPESKMKTQDWSNFNAGLAPSG